MRRSPFILPLVVALCGVLPSMTAHGSEAVKCVQAELLSLGHDPGPVDGAFGARTASAFAALAQKIGDKAPFSGAESLNAGNASDWCKRLATISRQTDLGGLKLDVADDVPAERLEEITDAIGLARSFIDRMLGGDIAPDVRSGIVVKVVATGRGNDSPSGGGSPATALAEGYPVARLFFDVAHPQWSQNTQGRGWTTQTDNMKIAIHEYTHAWQASLGALSLYEQELGNWMNEGIAEYVGYRALEEAGRLEWSDVQVFMARSSRGPQADEPLQAFGTSQSPAWAGHIGFLAIDWLVSETPAGMGALRTVAMEIAAGRSQEEAFRAAFGLELSDFYDQFNVWRDLIRTDPAGASAGRPTLKLAAK